MNNLRFVAERDLERFEIIECRGDGFYVLRYADGVSTHDYGPAASVSAAQTHAKQNFALPHSAWRESLPGELLLSEWRRSRGEDLRITSSTFAEIRKMAAELDAFVPREGARVCSSQYGGGADESKLVGNQRGYLRLGIEFLRAALTTPNPEPHGSIDVDLRYLLTDDSTVRFDWFERSEDLDAAMPAGRKPGWLISAIVTGAITLCLALAVIGLGTVISWTTR
jgi:hypothetical protein